MDPRQRIPFRPPATVALSRITREIAFSCSSSQQWRGSSRRSNAITTVGYTPRRDARVAHLRIKFVQRNASRTCGETAAATYCWSHVGGTRYRLTVLRTVWQSALPAARKQRVSEVSDRRQRLFSFSKFNDSSTKISDTKIPAKCPAMSREAACS